MLNRVTGRSAGIRFGLRGFNSVQRLDAAWHSLATRAAARFPEQVFVWHRDRGTSTFRLRTREQIMALGGAALIAGWLGVTASGLQGQDAELAAKQAELARLQSQVVSLQQDSAALKGNVAATAARIEGRQAFLAGLLGGKGNLKALADMMPRQVASMDSVTDAALEPFRKVETAQLAFVDKATGAAQARLKDTQSLLRRLGLDPDRFVAQSDVAQGAAMGGPYVPVAAPADAEPRFKSLFLSWKKLAALESAMSSVPSYMPVKTFTYTSGFGTRYDPFNGNTAMHAGLDMAGSYGEPVYAAAEGIVDTAAKSGAYGNLVQVEHGKGIATRYGHLSAILVHPGEHVSQGQLIARMGSTGRSTGTHLHFEVRLDGRAVNPRPYLDASAFMLAAQSRGAAEVQGPVEATLVNDDATTTYSIGGMTRISLN